jgi:hypothetical protein
MLKHLMPMVWVDMQETRATNALNSQLLVRAIGQS